MREDPIQIIEKKCVQHPLKNSRKDCDICGEGMCSICTYSTGTQKICPKCYEKKDVSKTAIESKDDKPSTAEKKESGCLVWLVGGAVVLVIFGIMITIGCIFEQKPGVSDPDSDNLAAISLAQDIVRESLVAPSTEKFLDDQARSVWHDHNHYIVFEVVDSQNAFGAMLRKRFLVGLTLNDNDRSSCKYSKSVGIQECADPPLQEDVDLFKGIQGWDNK